MLTRFREAKNALLLEPPYTRLWMPQGLAKIATYIQQHGGKVAFDTIVPVGDKIDLIVMTTLFTYDYSIVANTLTATRFCQPDTPVIVGGILASMGADKLLAQFPDISVYKGVSPIIDQCVPDYSIDWHLEEKYKNSCWVFTGRGCCNSCGYCIVPKLEPKSYIIPNWKKHIVAEKKQVILCDNNISATTMEHQLEVFSYLIEQEKQVDVNAGIDCKHVTPELAKILGKVKFVPAGLKLAFDRISEDGIFQEAVELLIANGVKRSAIQAYVLFNFKDTPHEANYRAAECRRMKITPYPQQYTPLKSWDRKNTHIGKNWTWGLIRAFRYYWLLRGHYNHMTLDDFIRGNHDKEKSKGKVNIDSYDLSIWEDSKKSAKPEWLNL